MRCQCQLHPSFFVPLLSDDPKYAKLNAANWEYRMQRLTSICQQEFQLVYYGHFTYKELDELTVHEREMVYGLLVSQKTEEKEAYEKAMKESAQKHKH